jgi:hypothetical protein
MFVQWIEDYSEMHFKVIRWIYKHPGCTRKDFWMGVHGAVVREDSANYCPSEQNGCGQENNTVEWGRLGRHPGAISPSAEGCWRRATPLRLSSL